MLRHVIEHRSFGGLLGMAAGYSIVAIVCVLLIADGLARNSTLWPHVITTVGPWFR